VAASFIRTHSAEVARVPRKRMNVGTKSRALSDVYGSRWLTAGMGSVLLGWGDVGAAALPHVGHGPATPCDLRLAYHTDDPSLGGCGAEQPIRHPA
jgi:hypothetical protein